MTGTTVITTRARLILADTDTTPANQRWIDAVLMAWLNDGVQLITDLRPESLLTAAYTMGTLTAITAMANTVSIGNRYQEAVVDYVVARALSQESQDERDLKRANSHMKSFIVKAGLPLSLITQLRLQGA